MKEKRYISICLCVLVGLLMNPTAGVAQGDNITFSDLSGANGDPFTTYTEGNFTVTSILGSWFQGQFYGNPEPSIYDGPIGSPLDATIKVTGIGGSFTFSSVDYSSNNGTSKYDIMGFLNGVLQFDQSGTLVSSFSPFGFTTLGSDFVSTVIDSLSIDVFPGSSVTSLNLDNIATTPEPASLMLLVSGLIVLAGVAQRRR